MPAMPAMIRPALIALALVSLATPAFAQSRDHLAPINGVAFGDTLPKGRDVLGATFQEATAADDKMTNILEGTARLFGENFQITYVFGDGDKLDAAQAVAILDTDDFSVCKTKWTKVLGAMTTAFGKPDAGDDKTAANPPNATATFAYKGGAEVHAAMLGCLIQVNWAVRPPKD